jgi:hypothetical protein
MTLAKRLARLEQLRGTPLPDPPKLDLAPDILRRIAAAKVAGTFPQSLPDADLEAIVAASDKVRAQP